MSGSGPRAWLHGAGGPGRRPGLPALALLVACLLGQVAPAMAVPPAATVGAVGVYDKPTWIRHRVIIGERLKEIADRYGVSVKAVVRWNKLDPDRALIRAGQHLRVRTRLDLPQREKELYTVRRGDSWSKIAKRFDVDPGKLRKHWNRKAGRTLRAGQRVVVWVEPSPPEAPEATGEMAPRELPLSPVPVTSMSVGTPSRGRLSRGIQLPANPALYTVRNPANSYGSSHTIDQLQRGIAQFRQQTGFDREVVVADMSQRRGGRFRPHRSHRSGRDVDIRLPIARGVKPGTVPHRMSDVDWGAAWALIKALYDTGQVRYIFLSRSRQKQLRRAARHAGANDKELARMIQYPKRSRQSVVRHSRGHVKHFHVRFACAEYETACAD